MLKILKDKLIEILGGSELSKNIIDKKRDDEPFQPGYLFINVGSCWAMIQIVQRLICNLEVQG